MKVIILSILVYLPIIAYTQKAVSMADVESRRELSMADVNGRSANGVYRYYVKGESQPYTGVLYGRHPNGELSSWQEYKEGIGQGKWINYYENGTVKEVGYYNQNRVEGPITKYYSNGNIQAEGQYKDWRIRIGLWKYYDEEGQLINTEDYGTKGSIQEVNEYYERGDIGYSWYSRILSSNGFQISK